MRTVILILTLVSLASAFGKNKVQYQYMRWNYLEADHYTLYFHQDQGELPEAVYAWLGDIYADLSERFGYTHQRPVPTVIYESPALFEQTNIITEIIPEEVGGFTELFKTRIAVPFNGSFADLRRVLHHEMVHAFVFGAIYEGSLFRAASANVPLWFNEGLAELLSSGWDREADMYMLDRVLNSAVPPPGPMLNQGYIAYKGGQSFLYYLRSVGGEDRFNEMLTRFRETKMAEASIERTYKKSMEDLGKDWINELRRIYWPEIGRRALPSDHATPVTVSAKDRSRFNLRPRISPDGQSVAFFSDRKDYTRIIITDTNGKETRRISQHALSGSFESFQPMSGALCWSPDGSELAFVAKKGGRNDIRIVRAKNGRQTRRIRLPLSAITGLDWSKDGKTLALTGIWSGQTGLYIYELESGALSGLDEESPTTKESPRFSPDGKKIIYTTTDTAGLGTGPFAPGRKSTSNLTLFDIEKQQKRPLTDNKWNDKQAAFSPDGKSIVFVSDRNGIDNLYVASLDDPENPRPLTDYTGSANHPDWAADGSAIVFDNFLNQSWNVWLMEKPEEKLATAPALAPTRWAEHEEDPSIPFFKQRGRQTAADTSAPHKGKKPGGKHDRMAGTDDHRVDRYGRPIDRYGNRIYRDDRHRADKNTRQADTDAETADTGGVGIDTMPDPKPYRLRFTPDMMMIGLGIDMNGTAGQAIASFSDIMGDHRITFAGDMQIDFSEYAQIFATYQYMKLRPNFTVGGFYYKYYSYDFRLKRYYHDLETGGILGVSYPFSMFSRADAQILGRRILRTPLADGNLPDIENNAAMALLGYSFDNILWGITGPLRGFRGRARLHVAPPLDFTSEAYISGDVDMRLYTHIFRKYVWANRLTFGGTAGLDGKEPARKFFLGGSDNWFNYGVNSQNYYDNLDYSYYSDIISPLRGWVYFDITGDRMLLMNSEFRFPFIREISTVWPIPMRIRYINGALFMDAGYAWTKEEQRGDAPLPPKLMGGYGFGMRANLGIFVLRYDRGWPTDFRATRGPTNYFSLGAEF